MRQITKTTAIILILATQLNLNSFAQNDIPNQPPPTPSEGFLNYKFTNDQKSKTYEMLDQQGTQNPADFNRNQKIQQTNKTRAQEMAEMLQNQELTRAFKKITENSQRTMNENKEIATPLAVVAGAVSLWYGRSMKLFKGNDYQFSARVEGRTKRSEFNMNSPFLNGQVLYEATNGMGMGVGRSINSIQTNASIQYNVRQQLMTTEVRKSISPNIDLSFGANRFDNTTKIEYRLNF